MEPEPLLTYNLAHRPLPGLVQGHLLQDAFSDSPLEASLWLLQPQRFPQPLPDHTKCHPLPRGSPHQ